MVEAGRKAEPMALFFPETVRQTERERKRKTEEKEHLASSEEIKMQKGTEQNCQQRLRGIVPEGK